MMFIGISGEAGAGKDLSATLLRDLLSGKGYNFDIISFADPLKEFLHINFNLSDEQLYGDLKEVEDTRYPKPDGTFWTPRQLMQFIGTDVFRKIDDNYWINKFDLTNKSKYCIIPDVRFKNEADYVLSKGGLLFVVSRPGKSGSRSGASHVSEKDLNNYSGRITIDNIFDNVFDLKLYLRLNIIPTILQKLKENDNG